MCYMYMYINCMCYMYMYIDIWPVIAGLSLSYIVIA